MHREIKRREFIQFTVAAGGMCLCGPGLAGPGEAAEPPGLISPGCRKSKVKVARLFMGNPEYRAWPKPDIDLEAEVGFYRSEFAKLAASFRDVDFVVDQLVSSPEQIAGLNEKLKTADGILVIHLNMGISGILDAILAAGRPTMIFATPYSGHEWTRFGALRKQEAGRKLECLLTSDYGQLAAAVRPFRALHHLREAKILNVTSRSLGEYPAAVKAKFGTEIKLVGLEQMVQAYNAVSDADAKAEAERWTKGATAIVEPKADGILKSCKMALAFQRLLDEEEATVMTVDCYGTMYKSLCQQYAFPCIGFTRLNDMGLGGICESDLQCAMTHIVFQGLAGKPGFISDPTLDESANSIILAHCLGTRKMDGPDGPAAPYKLRTIMERQQGVVPQIQMRVGEKVTQALLVGTGLMPYFTGEIIAAPDCDRGCRTKINVRVDGDAEYLWKNWSFGLHRSTCYGDITKDLKHFCRFAEIETFDEASEPAPAIVRTTAAKA